MIRMGDLYDKGCVATPATLATPVAAAIPVFVTAPSVGNEWASLRQKQSLPEIVDSVEVSLQNRPGPWSYGCTEFWDNLAHKEKHQVQSEAMDSQNRHVLEHANSLEIQTGAVLRQLKSAENSLEQINDEFARYRNRIVESQMRIDAAQTVLPLQWEETRKVDRTLIKFATVEELQKHINDLHSVQQIDKRLTALEQCGYYNAEHSKTPGTLATNVSQQGGLLTLCNVPLSDVDLRLQELENATYNGVLLWRIQGYRQHRSNAKSGKVVTLRSAPFYTSWHGHKMAVYICLNGDGVGKGTHIALFLANMKHQYDPLLPWPFKQKVTFMLLDQIGSNHLTHTYEPNRNSSQRPQNLINTASGCPLFVTLRAIETDRSPYICNDTIFIKCIVDTRGL